MFEVIVAAVDSSPRAAGVVEAAREVADRFAGVVHLFRVVTLPPEFPAAARNSPDDLENALRAQATRELAALAGGHPRVIVDGPELGILEPWRAILQRAREVGAGLIVVGSHGYAGWDRILGTTAAKVANHADRPVLVVHQGPEVDGSQQHGSQRR
jgi:nucleotide-binding universal stress UspA family protein